MLDVDYAADEHSRMTDERSAWFDDQAASEMAEFAIHYLGVLCRCWRTIVCGFVVDSQAVAAIDTLDRVAVGSKLPHHFRDTRKRPLIRIELHDLRSDVNVDTADVDAG